MRTQKSGQQAEQNALAYLTAQGLRLVMQNYYCRLGEIDLIMRDGAYLVFVEVRSRTNTRFGGGIASITPAKRRKILTAATHYLMTNRLLDKNPSRFDVVSIDGKSGTLTWLKDAFNAD